MAILQNTALRDSLATSWGANFNSGSIQILTSADVVLATITLGASPFTAPSTGTISKNGTWSATATGTGTAAKALFRSSDTLRTATFTVATSGGDLTIDNASVITGATVTVTAFSFTQNAT